MNRIMWAENSFPKTVNPVDSIYSIELCGQKCGLRGKSNSHKLFWAIDWIIDKHVSKDVVKGEMSYRKLAGKGEPSNKGAIDLALMKQEVLNYLLTQEL